MGNYRGTLTQPRYNRAGNTPALSSYPERPSYMVPPVHSYRDPTSSQGWDQYDQERTSPPTKERTLKDVFDIHTELQNEVESLSSSHPMETVDFPDLFDLPDLGEVFIARVQNRHTWPFQCMRMKLVDNLDVVWNEMVFNDTGIERVPEEGVPTLSTFQSMSHTESLCRWAKGAKIERTAYLTLKGKYLLSVHIRIIRKLTAYFLPDLFSSGIGLFYSTVSTKVPTFSIDTNHNIVPVRIPVHVARQVVFPLFRVGTSIEVIHRMRTPSQIRGIVIQRIPVDVVNACKPFWIFYERDCYHPMDSPVLRRYAFVSTENRSIISRIANRRPYHAPDLMIEHTPLRCDRIPWILYKSTRFRMTEFSTNLFCLLCGLCLHLVQLYAN